MPRSSPYYSPRQATGHVEEGVYVYLFPLVPFQFNSSLTTPHYQLIFCSMFHTPVVASYVQPRCPPDSFSRFLTSALRCLRGRAVITGDLNARQSSWDTATNRQGSAFSAWSHKAIMLVSRPPTATCRTNKGESRVDLMAARGIRIQTTTVHPFLEVSDHAPVTARMILSDPSSVDFIPLSLVNNPRYISIISRISAVNIPKAIHAVETATTIPQLEAATTRLVTNTISPWAAYRKPQGDRFRPGWTRNLDRKAKERTSLLKRAEKSSKNKAAALDKQIKRKFRRNKRKLLAEVTDELAGDNPSTDNQTLKRLLQLKNSTAEVMPPLDPDKFTAYIK